MHKIIFSFGASVAHADEYLSPQTVCVERGGGELTGREMCNEMGTGIATQCDVMGVGVGVSLPYCGLLRCALSVLVCFTAPTVCSWDQ